MNIVCKPDRQEKTLLKMYRGQDWNLQQLIKIEEEIWAWQNKKYYGNQQSSPQYE